MLRYVWMQAKRIKFENTDQLIFSIFILFNQIFFEFDALYTLQYKTHSNIRHNIFFDFLKSLIQNSTLNIQSESNMKFD